MGIVSRLMDWLTVDETDVMGYCPECGAEIQRRDQTTIRARISPGPTNLTSGYRCPNAMWGRNDEGLAPPPGGYCTPSYKEKSEWVYRNLNDEPTEDSASCDEIV